MQYAIKLLLSILCTLAVTLTPAGADDNQMAKAVIDCDHAEVERLLSSGENASMKDSEEIILLLSSAFSCDSSEIPDLLIQAGVDINAKNSKGATSLHVAVFRGNIKIVTALIAAGADINAKTKDGFTPLHSATSHPFPIPNLQKRLIGIAIALIEAGVDVNSGNIDEFTPLHFAAQKGGDEVVIALIQAGANVNAKTKDGLTPLHFAAFSEQTEPVIALIRAGAYIHATDNHGFTPLDIAKARKNWDVAAILENPPPIEYR